MLTLPAPLLALTHHCAAMPTLPASRAHCGVVVDAGFSFTHVVPIFDGKVSTEASNWIYEKLGWVLQQTCTNDCNPVTAPVIGVLSCKLARSLLVAEDVQTVRLAQQKFAYP